MSKVIANASMSIDGFIAGPNESGFEHLFEWYSAGDVELPLNLPGMTFKTSAASAEYFSRMVEETGVLVVGRKLWDSTKAWGGRHPMDRTVVVVTHTVPEGWAQESDDFVFVTEGIEAAIAKAREIAGDRNIGVNGGTIARQCVDAGLLDEIGVDLVPVLLGAGTPFFEQLGTAPVLLDGPLEVIAGERVTHLRYAVRR
ncbi:MAG: deaminase [Hamadaea sp.]|nr:deaminase [Hamadaea sp.]